LTRIPAGSEGTVRATSEVPDDTYLLVRFALIDRVLWARVAPWLVEASE
jgi:hypothetical protein